MGKTSRNTERGTRNATNRIVAARVVVPACLAIIASCLLFLTGCANESNFAIDPLLGGPPAPRPTAPAAVAPTSEPRQASLPALTVPTGSTSTAALATGTVQPLDPRPELRAVGQSGSWRGSGTQAGAVLQPPEPASDSLPRSIEPATGMTPVGASRLPMALNYEQAQALLAARGVTFQRLEAGAEPGEWKFTCSVPNRQNPHIRRVYEAQSRDAQGLGAMRAVLEQMDREQ